VGSTAELLAALPWGVLVLDAQGLIQHLNPPAAHWCGGAPATLLGQPLAAAPLPPALGAALGQLLAAGAAAPAALEVWLAPAQQWLSLRLAPAPAGQRWVLWEDVTARKQAEAAQHRSSQLLHDMETVAHTGSYEFDVASGDCYFSDGMYRLFGEAPGSFVPSPAFVDGRSHPADVAAVQQVLAEAVRARQPYTYRRRIRHADGGWRTLEAHGEVRCDAAGAPSQLRGLVQDVSARVQAEQALHQSRALLRATIDSSLDMVQVFEAVRDGQGAVVDFAWVLNNAAAERQYGDVIGQHLCQRNPGVVAAGIFDTFKQVLATGVPDQREHHYVHEQFDGWFYQSTVKLGDGVVTTTQDITERKRIAQELSESKTLLQDIINAPNIGIAVYKAVRDEAGAVVDFAHEYINRASEAMLGADFTGRLLSDHGANGTTQLPRFGRVLATGQGDAYVRQIVFRGQPRWFGITNTPLDGDRLVHTWEDVTERQQAEAELLRLQSEATRQVADRYQALFNSIDEGYALIELLYDDHGQVTDFLHLEVNPMAERINGFTNMAGRRIRELLPEVEDYWLALYGQVAASGEPARAEHYVAAQHRWFSVYASRVGGPGSRHIAAVFDDITARKQREASQTLLVKIVDDLQGLTSPAELLQLVGARLGEHLRLATCSFVDVDEARGAMRVQASWHRPGVPSRQDHTFRLGDFMTADLQRACRAGETVAVSDTATDARVHPGAHARLRLGAGVAVPFHRDGRWQGFLTATATAPRAWQAAEIELVQEVAARVFPRIERARAEEALRASEEKYRTLFDAMDEAYCIIQMLYDPAGQPIDWRYQEVNPAFEKHNGLANARGKTIRELSPDIEPKWMAVYGHVAATGESRRFEETSDALQRSFDLYAFRVGEPGAGLVAVLFTDVTERKRRAQQQDYLLKLSDALRELTNPADIQTTATALLRQHLGLDQAHYTEAGGEGEAHPELPALLHSRPWTCPDVAADPGLSAGQRAAYRAQGIGAAVAVPLRRHGRLVATLVATSGGPRAWAPPEVALVAETAERTWAAAERARTEAALAASEQRLRALITNLPGAAAFVVGADLRYQLAGGEALDRAGLVPADLLGRTVAEAVPLHLVPQHEAHYRHALAGQGFSLEHEAHARTFISRGVPLPGPAGLPEAVLVVSYDITARKQAEEALRASQAQLAEFNTRLEQRVARRTQQLQANRDLLQSVFDTSFISLSVLHAVRDEAGQVQDFRLALVNKELERETGRTDLVGKHYAQEYPGIRQVGIYDLMLRALATGEPQGMEYFYDHEGFNRWFTCQFVKLGDDGLVATNLDITERKTAEQERIRNLRLLEQAEAVAGLGSWDYDLASGTMRWSDGMYHLFGLPVGSPVGPATYLRQVVASDRPQARQLVRRLRRGSGPLEETLRLHVGGQVQTVRIKAVVLRNEAGQPVRVLGVDLDITELQRLEADNLRLRLGQQQALFEAVQAAQETERARMAESLHNGIGQILYATKLRLDRLHAPLLGTDPTLAAARREADDLLGEAMRQTRALSHELVPSTLKEFGLAAALQDISHKMSAPPLRLRSQVLLDDEAGELAPTLQMALYRMAQELAQNIAKHARGATRASLELETMPGWVLLRAEDNGAGFAPGPAESAGLGLRSIRDRVALLGGQLQVGSTPTGGAYVRIRIPFPAPSIPAL